MTLIGFEFTGQQGGLGLTGENGPADKRDKRSQTSRMPSPEVGVSRADFVIKREDIATISRHLGSTHRCEQANLLKPLATAL